MAKLSIGSLLPDLSFDTQDTQGLGITQVLPQAKHTIFWVLRYIGCTTCRYDVHVLSQLYTRFAAKDAQIYVVMQSQPETVRRDLADSPLPFPIICDPEMAFYKAFDIFAAPSKEARMPKLPADIARLEAKKEAVKAAGFVHGDYEGDEQQLPALFIAGQDGVVRYAHYAAHSIDMPTPEEVLALLDTLD